MSDNTESILILFKERKKETPNSFFYEKKFSLGYKTKIIHISDYLKKSNKNIVATINDIIKKEKISIVLFEGDHLSIFDINFIELIDNTVKKGIFLQDDYMYHFTNRITASACDFVFPADPLSVLKFKELGYETFWLPVESSGTIFKDYKEEKIHDVLFFGRVKNNRSKIIKYLKENNIKIFECGPSDEISNTPEKLAKLINQSKIVLNFTESDNTDSYLNPLSSFKYYFHIKGRVYFVGMCGTLSITEYSPAHELLFNENELPQFRTKEDCLEIVKDFLSDNTKLIETTKRYQEKCMQFEDSVYIKKVKNFIDEIPENRKKIKVNIPYWYEFIFFKKNIMLRFRLNNFSSFFKQIFDSIFLTKYKSKFLLPIFLILSIFASILFILKFPLAKIKT